MKHLWQMVAVGGTLVLVACADSPASPASLASALPELHNVPANISIPSIRGSAAGQFEIDANGIRRYMRDDGPIYGGGGSDNCYDVCDDGSGGDSGGDGGSGGASGDTPMVDPVFTEAHFEGDKFIGHAEMTYLFADHATQEMTLTTAKADGSTISSQKFTTARVWALPVPFALTLETDGSIFAPKCGARGQGVSTHEAFVEGLGRSYLVKLGSQSTMMNQAQCTSTSGTRLREEQTTQGSGGLRICLREDHYSSTGEYIYTATIYCYDVLNQT